MTSNELDVIVRVAGTTLLLAAALVWGSRDRRGGLYFLPLALCLCGFLAGNTPDAALRLSDPAGQVAHVLAGFAAVFLWWFCLAVFDRSFRPRGAVLVVGLAWIVIAAADRGLFGPTLGQTELSRILVVIGLGMVAYLAWRLLSDRRDDLIASRRRARVAVVAVIAAQLLADLLVDLWLGFDWRPQGFTIAQNAALLALAAWLFHLAVASRPTTSPATAPTPRPDETDRLHQRLIVLIETDRLHLDPDLSFDRFVRAMGASDRSVRRLIHDRLGFDHFRTFLNHHRTAEACRLLSDPVRRSDKLIAIAFDSGFASLASFNRVFRETQGRTPSAFRNAAPPSSEERPAAF